MLYFVLQPEYTADNDSVFRSVGITPKDRAEMTAWRFAHQQGREAARASFGTKTFCWRDSLKKKMADFPLSGEPGGVFSAKAIAVLDRFLRPNGDLYPLAFQGGEADYTLFDCYAKIDTAPNLDFNIFNIGSLKKLTTKSPLLPDIFITEYVDGPIVSQAFKAAAEAAGLTGMFFHPVEVLPE